MTEYRLPVPEVDQERKQPQPPTAIAPKGAGSPQVKEARLSKREPKAGESQPDSLRASSFRLTPGLLRSDGSLEHKRSQHERPGHGNGLWVEADPVVTRLVLDCPGDGDRFLPAQRSLRL